MAAPDPIAALVAFLKADADVAALAGTRVFAGELPRTENTAMPRQAVVLGPAGGGALGGGYQRYGDGRVDAYCYGATPRESWVLYLAVHVALKQLRREVHSGVLLHWARPSAGGATGRDPETDWPLTLSSWQVLASEVAA